MHGLDDRGLRLGDCLAEGTSNSMRRIAIAPGIAFGAYVVVPEISANLAREIGTHVKCRAFSCVEFPAHALPAFRRHSQQTGDSPKGTAVALSRPTMVVLCLTRPGAMTSVRNRPDPGQTRRTHAGDIHTVHEHDSPGDRRCGRVARSTDGLAGAGSVRHCKISVYDPPGQTDGLVPTSCPAINTLGTVAVVADDPALGIEKLVTKREATDAPVVVADTGRVANFPAFCDNGFSRSRRIRQ